MVETKGDAQQIIDDRGVKTGQGPLLIHSFVHESLYFLILKTSLKIICIY